MIFTIFIICNLGVAYLSDKVWKDLSKHFNFLMTPAALHVFITSNRGGILKILGLVKENEAEQKSANQLDDIDIDKCMYIIRFYNAKQ